ncbi:hypothetical protein MYX84_08140 [Acidobacteria bacterium AH-259-O06]|nr:hypothetical protein [Acidobacteria bacterium AH-259-O06]
MLQKNQSKPILKGGITVGIADGVFEEVSLLYGVAYNADPAPVSGMGCDVKDFNNDG